MLTASTNGAPSRQSWAGAADDFEVTSRLALLHPEVLSFFNTNHLHLSSLLTSERADKEITKDLDILIELMLNRFRHVAVTLDGKALRRDTQHPLRADLPDTHRRRAIVDGQTAVDRKALACQLWMLAAGPLFGLNYR